MELRDYKQYEKLGPFEIKDFVAKVATTAALGMVCEQAKSQVPALGYTVTYAVGNTLLTIWGMVLIILLS